MKGQKKITDSGFALLAGAIIERACNDYIKAAKDIKKMQSKDWYKIIRNRAKKNHFRLNKKNAMEKRVEIIDEAEKEMKRIRRFIRSEWFAVLCELDPEYLIEKLEEKVSL